jgi:DNA polymerase alpha subunit A
MADLLGEVDTNLPRRPAPRSIKTEAGRKIRVLSPSISENRLSTAKKQTNASDSYMPDTPPALNAYDDDDGYLPTADDDAPMSDLPLQSSPVQKAMERKSQPILKIEEEEEDLMEVAQPIGHAPHAENQENGISYTR